MKKQDKTIKEKETEKINDKKINKKKIILYIVGLAIVIYLLYTIYLLIKEPTNIVTVEEGKLYQEETDIGYVIRDEKVVKGENYKNGMEQIIAEGERASNNENIFRYYSANEESLKQKISELDAKIQEVMLNDKSLLTADIKLLENQIDEKLEDISKITDVTKLTEYKKEIDNLITKKAKMAGESSPKGSYLRQLIEERKNYENQLNSGAEYVKAPMSGIVSYRVDGLEETLTPDNFSALSKEYLESLNLKTGKIVATNEECGKVINNFVCYIATITSSEEAKQAKVGDEIKVRLSNNVEVSAEISNIVKEDEDILIILKLNKQVEELINYRKITFNLIWWDASGLKIPNQAIVQENDLNYVIRNRAGYLSKILVKVKKQGEKYSIVEAYKTEELKELVATTTSVLRNGKEIQIPIKEVTIGDIVLLSAGSMIPADLRIIESKDLYVGQSALTGESDSVKKLSESELSIKDLDNISDLDTICFMGTNVISGSAKGVVIKTADSTYFGKIAHTLTQGKPKTAFQKGIESISKLLIRFMLIMIPIVFLLNAWKHSAVTAFTFAVAIAIAITPLLLPVILSSSLLSPQEHSSLQVHSSLASLQLHSSLLQCSFFISFSSFLCLLFFFSTLTS